MHSLLWGSDHQHLIVIVMLQEAEVLNGRIAMVAFATLVSPCTSFGCKAHVVYASCASRSPAIPVLCILQQLKNFMSCRLLWRHGRQDLAWCPEYSDGTI